jgi:hypothetical protein
MKRSICLRPENGKCMVVLCLWIAISLASCGGGGGGSGGGGTVAAPASDGTPALSSVLFTPASAPNSTIQTFTVSFHFTDSAADLDSGGFYITYGGTNFKVATLGGDFAGQKFGNASVSGIIILDGRTGSVSIPCWLLDKLGHKSNVVTVTITQT